MHFFTVALLFIYIGRGALKVRSVLLAIAMMSVVTAAQGEVVHSARPVDVESKVVSYSPSVPIGALTTPSLLRGAAAVSAPLADIDTTFTPVFDYSPANTFAAQQQPDGKILVGGLFKSINGHRTSGILRLNTDRSVDTSFIAAVDGSVFTIELQPDGRILVGGSFNSVGGVARYSIARLNTDGSLDPTLNTSAITDNAVRDILLLPDGKIIAAGTFAMLNGVLSMRIGRLNADGSSDATFQSPLRAGNPPGTATYVWSVARQADGRYIIAGSLMLQFGPIDRRTLMRLNADGSLDESFSHPPINDIAWSLDLQDDGKVVIGGFFTSIGTAARNRIARLNTDGSLDTTFDPGTGANSTVVSVRLHSGGKVMIGGSFATVNGVSRGGIASLGADGSLDTTFAPAGFTAGPVFGATPLGSGYLVHGSFVFLSGSDRRSLAVMTANGSVDESFNAEVRAAAPVNAIATRPDGKILVGGSFNQLDGVSCMAIARLNPNGSRDVAFDSGGVVGSNVVDFVAQPDGKVLVIGSLLRFGNRPPKLIIRLNADGSPDQSFDQGSIPQGFVGRAAAVQPDGKILFSYQTGGTDLVFGLVRLNSNGTIDATFAGPTHPTDAIHPLADGKILIAGPFGITYVSPGGFEPHLGIIRLNADGSHDRSFQSGLVGGANPFFADVRAMHVRPDGKIFLGGRLHTPAGPDPLGVVRLNDNGSIDNTFAGQVILSQFYFGAVTSLHVMASGRILAGGVFEGYGGLVRRNLVRLLPGGQVDTTFAAGTDKQVNTIITEANGSILIGGEFATVNGTERPVLARLLAPPQNRAPFDFDGDGKTDIGIFRPTDGTWWINRSSDSSTIVAGFGAGTDVITPGDFTGDGKADIAFWRPSNGYWFVLRSEDSAFFAFPFGTDGDIPVPADYDNDGKTDAAVFRPSESTWYILKSNGGVHIEFFGQAGDRPVPADYDGDGRADIAIFRPSDGTWWLNRSTAGLVAVAFGTSSDKQTQGDFTGDGKADVAFWRPSNGFWFVLRSEDFAFFAFPFGTNGDIPAPGDYDGDGKFDATVFRPSQATWYSNRSTAGVLIQGFGASADRPVPNAYVP